MRERKFGVREMGERKFEVREKRKGAVRRNGKGEEEEE